MSITVQHEMIRASAGTGKTHQLTTRYLRLLRQGEAPDEILASTFTRKAAGEILGRILLRLAEAVADPAKLDELREALHDGDLSQDDCLTLLVNTTRRLHRLRISTLDSFFAQLGGSFALEIGLPPGWRIADEHEDSQIKAQAIESMLDEEDPRDLLTLVHKLTLGETTRSLDREIRDKVTSLYAIYRDSSQEAWHRVPRPAMLPAAELDAAIETLRTVPLPAHKTWETSHAKDLGQAEAGDWDAFINHGIAAKVAAGETTYSRKPIDVAVAAAYRTLLDHAAAVQLNRLANQTEATYELLSKFHVHYQRLKSLSRTLRFDDVTWQLAERIGPGLLRPQTHPTNSSGSLAERLAFRLDAQLRHLLLDEFQDTSLSQWAVLSPFADRITASKDGQSFFCVGDTKQAIYGWRGGVAEIFNAVTQKLPKIHQRPLDTSWRSSPIIMQAVNRVVTHLDKHKNLEDLHRIVTTWQKQFNEHHSAPKKQQVNGYVCLQAARVAAEDDDDKQEYVTLRYAAEQVVHLRSSAPGFSIGVLVLRNRAVRRLIYELRELGVEASEEGGSSLDDSAAVQLIRSLLQLADHPGDRVASFHVAHSPLADLLHLPGDRKRRMEKATLDSPQDQTPEASAVENLTRDLRRRLMDYGYGATVYELASQLAPACNRRELRRLEKLIGLAYQYDDMATSRPQDFVNYLDAAKVRDPIAADVRVMTIHQAKGLEFDIVVLADLEDRLLGQREDLVVGRPAPTEPIDRICRRCSKNVQRLLPVSWQKAFRDQDEQDLSESLCVLYVAVTRAIHALHMIVSPSEKNERSLHKDYAGLLRAALTDGARFEPEAIGFELGDRNWHRNPGVSHPRSEGDAARSREALPALTVQLAKPIPRRWRGLQQTSPSALEGGRFSRIPTDGGSRDYRSAALARGTLMHAWFETITWLDDGSPNEETLREVAMKLPELGLRDTEIRDLMAGFFDRLGQPQTAAALRRSAYSRYTSSELQVETERSIAFRDDNRFLVGSIDRLVTMGGGGAAPPVAAEIIDFKTDALNPHDASALESRIDMYRPQLEAYRQAVSANLRIPIQAITSQLLFVHIDKLVCLS